MTDGDSKCGRKTALSIFFALSLVAFLFCLISFLSPSWQFVSLENGRTEHHHGLWLDCKRDYSFDYGRTREYYETLYRRDMQGSPFEMFFLPPLQCVYKFDYYIDPEDLYDHNHDENRLQNDAYQHLFLGWKVAALAAVGVAVCFSAASILLGICAFCHRTFICASTVLVTISAILSSIGIIVFYMWANYQDNKVIKEEEDTIYEQILGWAFYFQVVGALLHWLCSLLGCCVTSLSLGKNRGAKLVKIEVVEGEDDSMLLQSTSSVQPFKRSYSAIYKVDSQSLRQFEREYMRQVQHTNLNNAASTSQLTSFKRTASVPNFTKKQKREEKQRLRQMNRAEVFSSTSNITESTRTGSVLTLDTQRAKDMLTSSPIEFEPQYPPVKPLKSALKTPQSSRRNINEDSTYEYLPCPSSMAVSTYLSNTSGRAAFYDEVYEEISPETYLEPNSLRTRSRISNVLNEDKKKALTPPSKPIGASSMSIPLASQPKTTVIDDVIRPHSATETGADIIRREKLILEKTRREQIQKTTTTRAPDVASPKPIIKAMLPPTINPPMTIRDFGVDLKAEPKGYYTEISHKVYGSDGQNVQSTDQSYTTPKKSSYIRSNSDFPNISDPTRMRLLPTNLEHPSGSVSSRSEDLPGVSINTFANKEGQRSITNLAYVGKDKTAADLFDRPESIEPSSSSDKKIVPTIHRSLFRGLIEVDRSVGSSTLIENDTMSETGSYARDAEIRLNLFLNDGKQQPQQQDETTV